MMTMRTRKKILNLSSSPLLSCLLGELSPSCYWVSNVGAHSQHDSVVCRPPPPMKVEADLLEAKHWIFPINRPKRDYQFNIVKNSLFENTLVALPTGLGKTFIAGVVMLNYYRWFPEGKVVFVAPTKPLVAQQVIACHETCGIPGGDSIEMTGEVAASVRARYWENKRVFFMTPQTLVNDLVKENCDAKDIVLLVVDEAHRATGEYAYNQAIRFLMAKNPHFRVLALTATPGNNPEAVQLLVDGLHISRIEIRDEQSVDLRAYIHKKVFKAHIITANEGLAKVRDLLVKVMDPHMKKMFAAGVFHPGETAVKLHPYRAQASMQRLPNKGLFGSLSTLGKLARAMLYLLTGSFTACYIYLSEISNDGEDAEGGGKKNASSKKLKEDPNFRALMNEFERQRAHGFSVHPKVEKLKSILIQHFGSKLPEEDGTAEDTKVMVFSNYRGVVDEITEELNKEQPLIRATRFIGQGTDKQGKKGLAQKEQNDIIKRFKAGEFNVLVCTSIGEEGLDIGEIDMTVCYDADKAPTRMIQRFGRTGRAREGIIHALLFEGREETNIEKAEATYKEVQNVVNKGINYELYGDVKRLIPDHIKPQCVEKVVEIQHYVRDEPKKKESIKKAGSKRKRNDDIARNIPTGASTGFVSVRDLVVKGTKKPKKALTLPEDFEHQMDTDDDDRDIEQGDILALRNGTARPVEEETAAKPKPKPKPRVKKAATAAVDGDKPKKARAKKTTKKKTEEKTLSQLLAEESDSDDAAIEAGVEGILNRISSTSTAMSKSASKSASPGPSRSSKRSPKRSPALAVLELSDEDEVDEADEQPIHWSSSPKRQYSKTTHIVSDFEDDEPRAGSSSLKQQIERSILELSDSEGDDWVDSRAPKETALKSPGAPRVKHPEEPQDKLKNWEEQDQNMSWLIDDDDDEERPFEIVDSSPIAPKQKRPLERVTEEGESFEISAPVLDDDVIPASDPLEEAAFPEPVRLTQSLIAKGKRKAVTVDSPRSGAAQLGPWSPFRKTNAKGKAPRSMPSSPTSLPSSSPLYPTVDVVKSRNAMLPPALPRRLLSLQDDGPLDMPEPSHPIRPVGHQAKRRRVVFDEMESPSTDLPPQPQRRLRHAETTPMRTKPTKEKRRREKPSLLDPNVNLVFDGEAAHSGDEESEGYSEEEEENEYDRMFIKDSPVTQAPQSYNQSMVYRRSLLTQGPTQGPAFANHPLRPKPFGRTVPKNQNRYLPSSSPPPPDDELDSYEVGGSFVVDDDAEISYEL
ncbi:hypothetical protein D9619_003333 [Psilocybe cf. subviscida]|uniref:ATP-dependent DNA helicase n=1 Tax=Psilocybe cf. subviscida TaxID=2480587 RepID=A0A8H5EU92_9AGAR|nr:hypothetical protein D9619_003333 [Psilocybe cf. subviscida]